MSDIVYPVVVENLSKIYPNGTKALDNVSVSIDRGITCVVGPNGAGKTTLLKILATQMKYTSGKVEVLGYDVERKTNEIRKGIAVVPQESMPVNELTPFEHVYYYLLSRGVERNIARKNTEYTLHKLGLWNIKDKLTISLSGGMKRRVLIAMALATRAPLILLDEPTIGLDPISRKETWALISEIKEDGTNLIITTHYMEEAEALGNEMIVINKGKILARGTAETLKKNLHFDKKIAVEKGIEKEFLEHFGKVVPYGNFYFLYPEDLNVAVNNLLSKNISFQIMSPSLEDVFMEIIGNNEK
ncbi:MAG: ABC transporter ATP-binding protein [Caldisericum sp.]|jgi:ABC-2 type transport system ATP-binding protein|nr:ABC transporter ATP-binding protein [Caldisericum sp.]